MKTIKICGIKNIEHHAQSPWKPRTSLISIGDTGSTPPNLIYKPERILRIEFDDITLHDLNEEYVLPQSIKDSEEKQIEFIKNEGITVFSNEQAEQIADFVLNNYDDTDMLVCQCHYGQSRSAGCAAAIAEYFFKSGITVFADERYLPNKLVYHKVLNALKAAKK